MDDTIDRSFPEIPGDVLQLLKSGATDDIRIDKEGNWFHNGEPFINKKIIDYFNRSVNITAEGRYVIHYGEFTYPIAVDDAPVFVTGVLFQGFGPFEKIILNLTTGEPEELDISTLTFKNKTLYCRVKNGRLPAKFMRSPCFHILERLDERNGEFYLHLCGKNILIVNED